MRVRLAVVRGMAEANGAAGLAEPIAVLERIGERVKVVSRRGEGVFPALIVRTIRPDTIFIPYHWGEQLAVNQLTNPALDPTSKIPEYKACAARIEKIHARELPILGKNRKGTSMSEVHRGKPAE